MPIRDYRVSNILNSSEGLFGSGRRQNRFSFGGDQGQTPYRFSFNQREQDPINFDASQGPQDEGSRFYDEIQRIRNTPTPGLTAYSEALKNIPQAADYKPGWMTRIAAGLSGLSAGYRDPSKGFETANRINRSNYDAALEQYSNRLGGLKEQASLEEADRRNRMDSIMDAYKMGLQYEDMQRKREADESLDRYHQGMVGAAGRRAGAAEASARAAAQGTYTYTPIRGGFMVTNNKNPNDRQIIKADTIQDAQLQISARNASVGEGNLDLNRQRTEGELENMASLVADRETGDYVQPSAQNAAAESVDNDMMLDPRWSRFYEKRGVMRGGIYARDPVGPNDFPPAVWKAYTDERAARIAEKLRMRR